MIGELTKDIDQLKHRRIPCGKYGLTFDYPTFNDYFKEYINSRFEMVEN